MNREIKFRVWNGARMYAPDEVSYIEFKKGIPAEIAAGGLGHLLIQRGEWEPEATLMQYTGLTDASGTEIYEGDVIIDASDRRYMGDNLRRAVAGVVKFGRFRDDTERAWIGIGFYWEALNGEAYSLFGGDRWDVLGNIYENPELLEGQSA